LVFSWVFSIAIFLLCFFVVTVFSVLDLIRRGMLRTKAKKVYWSTLDAVCLFGKIIMNYVGYLMLWHLNLSTRLAGYTLQAGLS
jgi:uncharacterized membrane protein YdbT with pleckstrin-like domain